MTDEALDHATIDALVDFYQRYWSARGPERQGEPPALSSEDEGLRNRLGELGCSRPDQIWRFVLAAVEGDPDGKFFSVLAAGELEDLLARHGHDFIERVESRAAADPAFATLLGGVWQQDPMPDRVWKRVLACRDRRGWDGIPSPPVHFWPNRSPDAKQHRGLTDRSVLVIGGTGGVGSGIVDALLRHGSFARVVVSSRDPERLQAVRERTQEHERLRTIRGGVDDDDAAASLVRQTTALGELGAVVTSIGGWWTGPNLTELDLAAWNEGLATLVTPHFVAAKTFVPSLAQRGGRYLLIGGSAATGPVPGSSLVSIAGTAQTMLARQIVVERPDDVYPIVEELIIEGAVATHAAHHGAVTANEITAREAGEVVAEMLHTGTTGTWQNVTRDGPLVTMHRRAR